MILDLKDERAAKLRLSRRGFLAAALAVAAEPALPRKTYSFLWENPLARPDVTSIARQFAMRHQAAAVVMIAHLETFYGIAGIPWMGRDFHPGDRWRVASESLESPERKR